MNRLWFAWAAVAAVLLSGCEREESAQAPAPVRAATAAPAPASGATLSAQARSAAYRQGSAVLAGDPAQNGRALFDGDTRTAGLSNDAVVADWAPAAAQDAAAYTAAYRLGQTRSVNWDLRDAPTSQPLSARSRFVPSPEALAGDLAAATAPKQGPSVLAVFDAFQRRAGDGIEVLSRAMWGARRPHATQAHQPTHVTVHHTDGHPRLGRGQALQEMRGYQNLHMDENGWADIGYHFVIDGAGRVLEGRPAEILGAHSGGDSNVDNLGIALMGDYNRDQLNEEQKKALRRLITFLALRYRGNVTSRDFIQPHKHYTNTDCPGRNVEGFLSELRREVAEDTTRARAQGRAYASNSFQPLVVTQ